MINKQTNNDYRKLQSLLVKTGIGVIIFATIATIFGFWRDQRFINHPFDLLYYIQYTVILGGGFAIGYVISKYAKRAKASAISPLFNGIVYSMMAFLVFNLLDYLRITTRNLFGTLPYPWEMYTFEGMSIAALLALLAIVAVIVLAKKQASLPSRTLMWTFVMLFLVQQVSMIISVYGYAGNAEMSVEWASILLLGVIMTPLFVAVVSYLCLGGIKQKGNRMFIATIIATIYFVTTYSIWEFRTNPDAGSTQIFQVIAMTLTYIFAAVFILLARRAVRP